MQVKPGMQFRIWSYSPGPKGGEGLNLFIIAVPTGWMINRSLQDDELPHIYFVPDKEHSTNPYAFWDHYSHGHGELDEDVHEQSPHQFTAWNEWKRKAPDRRDDTPYLVSRLNENQNFVTVDCPYCGKEHTHGYIEGTTHRLSHCSKDKRASSTGYWVYCEELN